MVMHDNACSDEYATRLSEILSFFYDFSIQSKSIKLGFLEVYRMMSFWSFDEILDA